MKNPCRDITKVKEIIKEYNLESGKYALEAEQKENLELFKLSNGLRCAVCY